MFMKIKVDEIWPGMLIRGHEDKGRVFDATWQSENLLRFDFEKTDIQVVLTSNDTIEIVNEASLRIDL